MLDAARRVCCDRRHRTPVTDEQSSCGDERLRPSESQAPRLAAVSPSRVMAARQELRRNLEHDAAAVGCKTVQISTILGRAVEISLLIHNDAGLWKCSVSAVESCNNSEG